MTGQPASRRSRSRRSRARRTRARSTCSNRSPSSPAREGLWFHVDAAYGAAARLSARDAGRVPGLELADSVTVDPHKWFFQAYDIGGLMVRDGSLLERTFGARKPEYYRGGEGPAGPAGAPTATTITATMSRASSTSTSSASRAPDGGGR